MQIVRFQITPTGHVPWAGDEILWFVWVKDAVGRCKGKNNWVNGCGWARFNAGDTDTEDQLRFQYHRRILFGSIGNGHSRSWQMEQDRSAADKRPSHSARRK
jgi:hypothetical protein